MRHTVCALASVVLVGCCCSHALASDARPWWSPFASKNEFKPSATAGDSTSAAATTPITPEQPAPPQSTDTEEERHWMINSPLAKVSWPRLHMPEMPKPHMPQVWPKKAAADEARNAWVAPSPDPNQPSPVQAVKNGARKVGDSTRAAWDKTVDAFTPDKPEHSPSSRVARRDENKRPFWKRMFAEEPEHQGPQTVTEWMAQERVDP